MLLIFSKLIFSTFFCNESKLIEYNNLFAIHCRSAEIIKKKKSENYSKDVTMEEFFKFFDQFNEKFIKSSFCCRIKISCDKTKLITKHERLYYLY